jgi:TonB-dependent starch-binding outer membrane protein SusC
VVVGYSSERKKNITGALAVVNTIDLNAVPSPNITQQLKERAFSIARVLMIGCW